MRRISPTFTQSSQDPNVSRPRLLKRTRTVNDARVPRSRFSSKFPSKTGFPKQMTLVHKYVDTGYLLTSTLGAFGSYSFSANGLFDPNLSGTGHQPLYFDQLGLIYNHYVVIKSKIRYILTQPLSTTEPMLFTAQLNDDIIVGGSVIYTPAEQPNSTLLRTYPGTMQPLYITKSYDAVKMFGPNPIANNKLLGTTAANPTEVAAFTLVYATLDGATTTTARMQIEIEYTTTWSELKDINSS